MTHLQFAYPWLLLISALVPVLIFLVKYFEKYMECSFRFANTGFYKGAPGSLRAAAGGNLIYLRAFIIVLCVLAIARPRIPIDETNIFVEGIDIVLAIDSSGSMQAMDFDMGGRRFDRLSVVKNVVEQFIKARPNDRIGIVSFSSAPYTICPLTLDHSWLEKNLERVNIGMMEDGTAIGSAISSAVNRLKEKKTKDKVLILLTDGSNNAGKISPLTAAQAAKALGIRTYTIGVGTKGMAPFPVKDMYGKIELKPVEVEMDEDLLKRIANITGGRYYRATDTQSLWDIYKEIDGLEKTKIEEVGFRKYTELFSLFLFPALVLLMIEILLRDTAFRRVP
ncbi:MAG: VWA domain-containing protein [Candidatus Omnitrophica bacterium]|nr:VWA domain-containing protein [Candidatus Omnitrophota bacterium]